jgi:hypothetical protein
MVLRRLGCILHAWYVVERVPPQSTPAAEPIATSASRADLSAIKSYPLNKIGALNTSPTQLKALSDEYYTRRDKDAS